MPRISRCFLTDTYKDENFGILPVCLNQGQSGDIAPAIECDLLWQLGALQQLDWGRREQKVPLVGKLLVKNKAGLQRGSEMNSLSSTRGAEQ